GPVGDFELLLCHGTVCVVGKMRDLILQLSKSSIYSTKPPQRLRSESGFAALCGVSPVPVSSGKTNRYRLNRGGDRAANSALHIIAIGRLRTDAKTKEYVARRVAEGHTKMEAIRCLKRYISREVYTLLRNQNRRINRIPITA
ncbi:transposase, partial [Escherichia coli]